MTSVSFLSRVARSLPAALLAFAAGLALAGAARAQSQLPAPPAPSPVPIVPVPVAPTPVPVGTPVLGPSLLSPAQMASWYASMRITPRSPTDVATLARLFSDEGAAQGVRGDLAFAQAMLETGYLRFGGLVLPSDNNFSGLGACDTCARGLAFPSAELGVRAQIQHLWAYAAPHASLAGLARPLADARFGMVQPPGRAPLWETMGSGSWATDHNYGAKVVSIWRSMLAWAGIPVPPPASAPGSGPQGPLLILSAASGAGSLGGWPLRREPLAGGISRLGAPASLTRAGAGCLARWPSLGAALLVTGSGDPCAIQTASVRWARLSGAIWRTKRGLAVGDSLRRLRTLYPKAISRQGRWWLVRGRDAATGRPAPRLRAELRGGRVRALWVDIG